MSLDQIDILQSEQIEQLQDDVLDLKDKLNLVVADVVALTPKLNQAIADADDLNTIINAGYNVASGGGSANIGILKRLDELFQQLEDHKWLATTASAPAGTWKETHPPDNTGSSTYTGWGSAGTSVSNLDGTAQGNNNARSTYTATAETATLVPVYTTDPQSVMTLKTKGERRAKKLSRTLIKRTR